MGVPFVTSMAPAVGPASGYNEVEIAGGWFNAITSFVPTVPGTARTPTVRVTFNGVAALRVDVASAELLRVIVPAYTGSAVADSHAAVDVVVSNLDSAGNVISGETYTHPSGYTYQRWKLRPPEQVDPLTKVTRKFLERLVLEVVPLVGMMTHVDFNVSTSGTEMDLSELPCIGVKADYPRDVEYSQWDNGFEEVIRDDGDIDLYRGMKTYMMVADLVCGGEGGREARALTGAVIDAFTLNPYITVTADETLFPGLTDQYPMDLTQYPKQASKANKSNVMSYSLQYRVRGIRTMVGVPVERIKLVSEAYLLETNMDGENVVTRQLV